MFLNVLVALAVILHVALAGVLIRKYLLSRDVGFIWLGIAVIVWPLVSRLVSYGEGVLVRRLNSGQSVGFYPFSLVESGQITLGSLVVSLKLLQQLIGVCLLLVAVLYLSRKKSNGKMQPTA